MPDWYENTTAEKIGDVAVAFLFISGIVSIIVMAVLVFYHGVENNDSEENNRNTAHEFNLKHRKNLWITFYVSFPVVIVSGLIAFIATNTHELNKRYYSR